MTRGLKEYQKGLAGKMTCLETTFLIDVLRGKKEIHKIIEGLEKDGRICISAPSIMEIWTGVSIRSVQGEKEKVKEFMQSFEILPLDAKSAMVAGEIEAGLAKRGQMIETEDIMTAAIAIANGEMLVTRDAHFARIEGLMIIKY